MSRDVFNQSSVGAIYTDEEYPAANMFNRIGGLDGRIKITPSWTATLQSVVSSTQLPGNVHRAGPASYVDTTYSGVHAAYEGIYKDVSPGFISLPGFVNRVDIRDVANQFDYRFRPEAGPLVAWGPSVHTDWECSHDGTRLDLLTDPSLNFRFKGQSVLRCSPTPIFTSSFVRSISLRSPPTMTITSTTAP